MRKIIIALSLLFLIAGFIFAIDIPTTGNGFTFYYVTEPVSVIAPDVFQHWFSDADNSEIDNNVLEFSETNPLPDDGIIKFRFHLLTNLDVGLSTVIETQDQKTVNQVYISGNISEINPGNSKKTDFEFKEGVKSTTDIIIDNIVAGNEQEYVYECEWGFDQDAISTLAAGSYAYTVVMKMTVGA